MVWDRRAMSADLADVLELRSLVDRYATWADRRVGAAVAGLFEPDGRLVLHRDGEAAPATSEVVGHAALEAAIGYLDRYDATTHFVGQHLVDLDGDDATGVAYCLAHHLGYEGEPTRTRVDSIRYLDRYRRHPDGWRFAERRLCFDWTEIRTVTRHPGPHA
jgi:hypothetical protein